MGILDKAKGASSAVADTAAGLKERTASLATGLKEQAQETMGDVAAAGIDRAESALAELSGTLPLLGRAGYRLEDVQVEIGISPKLQATFAAAPPISDEALDEIVRDNADKKLAIVLLRALVAASRMQARVKIADLKPVGLAIQVGLSPSVVVKFS